MFHSSEAVLISERVFINEFLERDKLFSIYQHHTNQGMVDLESDYLTFRAFKNVWGITFVKKVNPHLLKLALLRPASLLAYFHSPWDSRARKIKTFVFAPYFT